MSEKNIPGGGKVGKKSAGFQADVDDDVIELEILFSSVPRSGEAAR